MKQILLALLLLTGLPASADSLANLDEVNQVVQRYGVDPSRILQLDDIKLADAAKGEVDGPQEIVQLPGQKNAFFLYGSRIVYLKNKPADAVAKAFEMTSTLPAPKPVETVWDRNVQSLAPNHFLTTFGFRASQSKLIVTVTTNCKGATHHVAMETGLRIVQNKWIDCADKGDSKKIWYPAGWQTNQVLPLEGGITAVLVHSMIHVTRHKVGFITPSKEDIFALGIKASEDTLDGFLKRLGLRNPRAD